MGVYKRGDTWCVRITYCRRKIQRAIGKDYRQAVAAQKLLEKEIAEAKAAGIPWANLKKIQKSKQQPTFSEVANSFIQARMDAGLMKPSTLRTYRNYLDAYLLPAFGDSRVAHITEEQVKGFQATLAKKTESRKRSNRRVNNIVSLLRTLMKRCVKEGLIAESPCSQVERLREVAPVIDPFSKEELSKALKHLPTAYKPIFSLLAYTGMRPNEALALIWRDIDWNRHKISISKGRVRGAVEMDGRLRIGFVEGEPKTRKSNRIVPLPPALEPELRRLRVDENTCDLGSHVFTNRQGNPLSTHLDEVWKRALRRAGIRHRPSYQLRHTWASMALEEGENPGWVAEMLGHSTLEMMYKHYARFIPNSSNGTRIGALRLESA